MSNLSKTLFIPFYFKYLESVGEKKIYDKEAVEFFSKKENILEDVDKSVCKVDLPTNNIRVKFILDKILNINNIDKLKKYLSTEFKNYQPPKKYIKVSRTI